MKMKIRDFAVVLFVVVLTLGRAPLRAAEGDEPPRPLSVRGVENLVAFTRLLGYVRFFHPSDQAATAHWGEVAIAGAQAAERAVNPADLARTLEELFRPLAPTVRVFPGADRPGLPPELLPPANPEVVFWVHHGVPLSQDPESVYESERVARREAPPPGTDVPVPGEPLVVPLGAGVSALVPLSLYKDSGGTLPHVDPGVQPPTPDKPAGFVPSGNDRATRLADVALAWSTFQHFYPYFDVVKVDWPSELRRALIAAAKAPDARAFLDTLRLLVAALQDGHGNVFHASQNLGYQIPLNWDWVQNRLVITAVDPARANGLVRGDVVLSLNGRPVQQAIAAEEKLTSAATPQWKRWHAMQFLLAGAQDEEVRLKVQRARGGIANVVLRRSVPWRGEIQAPRPEKIAEVRPGIFYVDISRITDGDFVNALPDLAAARGIVFDLRGYPNHVSIRPLQHLTGEPARSAIFNIPEITLPDRRNLRFEDGGWPVQPRSPQLTGNIAFLTDGRAISYAETYMGIVEAFHLADIVGATTAGTNGNINPFTLPGGYNVVWTGMQVLKQDGSRHHGVGIHPTVPVTRTLKGVIEGRDEVLERGIAVVDR